MCLRVTNRANITTLILVHNLNAMRISPPISKSLNQRSLASFKPLFASLVPPELASLRGIFQAELVGPAWLRRISPIAIALGGMRGWWGKVFDGTPSANNLVCRDGRVQRSLPLTLTEAPSLVDGRPGITTRYIGCPFPWPFVVDELRWLDETILLGMMIVNVALLRALAFPFLLRRQDSSLALEIGDGL
jgi:hypothetical protein